MIFPILLLIPPLALLWIDASLRLLFIRFSYHYFSQKKLPQITRVQSAKKIAVVITGRNEASVISKTIQTIKSLHATVPIYLIADHCTDNTINIAAQLGARIYERTTGEAGKSAALAWFAQEAKTEISSYDALVILDADTMLDSQFFQNLNIRLQSDFSVIQAFVHPQLATKNNLNLLATYSEIISQTIDDAARKQLGWSVSLRGTGMIFSPEIFIEAASETQNTQVDDIELTINLINQKQNIEFCEEIVVYDPKPEKMQNLARQRGRWLFGQRQIFKTYRAEIIKLIKFGPPGWSLIHSMLFKPKTLLVLTKILALISSILLVFVSTYNIIAAVIFYSLLFTLFIDLAYYLYGLTHANPRNQFIRALILSPLYLIVWITSILFSLKARHGWLKARE